MALTRFGPATIELDGSLFGLVTDTNLERVWVAMGAQVLVVQFFDARHTPLSHEELMWRIAEAAVQLDVPLGEHSRYGTVRLVAHQNVRPPIDAIS